MKFFILLIGILLFAGCSNKVEIIKFSEIYPGMKCEDVDNYLKKNKFPFKKSGGVYKFRLANASWNYAEIVCDGNVKKMEFVSKKWTTPRQAKAYIDIQDSLLNTFRDNTITYEEGNKTINLNNGIKLHQFLDVKSGVITQFALAIEGGDSRQAWEKAAVLLPKVGTK